MESDFITNEDKLEITDEVFERLKQMILSKDVEDAKLALQIIRNSRRETIEYDQKLQTLYGLIWKYRPHTIFTT